MLGSWLGTAALTRPQTPPLHALELPLARVELALAHLLFLLRGPKETFGPPSTGAPQARPHISRRTAAPAATERSSSRMLSLCRISQTCPPMSRQARRAPPRMCEPTHPESRAVCSDSGTAVLAGGLLSGSNAEDLRGILLPIMDPCCLVAEARDWQLLAAGTADANAAPWGQSWTACSP